MEDYKKKLMKYLKKNIKKGYTKDALKWALIKQGYSRTIIEEMIIEANKELAKKVPTFKEKPQIKYEIIDEYNNPIIIKKSFLKRVFGL